MNIAVFGATGSVGQLFVDRALADDHTVTAVTRDRTKITKQHSRLRVVQADPTDPDQLEPVLVGCDVVVVTIGGGSHGGVRGPSTVAVIEAMSRAGVKRLICQSTLGAGDSRPQLTFWWKYVMFGLLLRKAYADHQVQEAAVRGSDLDWTLVRPSAFTDGPPTGDYQRNITGASTFKISRSDVADFLISQLTDKTYLHKAVAISY